MLQMYGEHKQTEWKSLFTIVSSFHWVNFEQGLRSCSQLIKYLIQ